MATIVEMLDELEKVRLAPIVLPALKILDPVLGALPRGFLKSVVSRPETRDSLVKTVEGLSPVLPDMIKLLGHIAESKLATGLLSLGAIVSAPFVRLSAPLVAKLVIPGSGPALKLASRSGSVLPPVIRFSDSLVRAELVIERPLRRILSFW